MNPENLIQKWLPGGFFPQRTLPHFIVIGARGESMRLISRQLSGHPGIWQSPIGELHFFDHEHVPECRESIVRWSEGRMRALAEQWSKESGSWKKRRKMRYLRKLESLPAHSEEWYRACFAFPTWGRIIKGEVSGSYAFLSEQGLRAIDHLIPDVRIVMVVRNPVDDVLHSLLRAARKTKGPLSAMEWQRIADDSKNYAGTRYSEITPLWDKVFGQRMIYLPFDLMQRNPDGFLKLLCERLDCGLSPWRTTESTTSPDDYTRIPSLIRKLVIERTEAEVDFLNHRFQEEFARLG